MLNVSSTSGIVQKCFFAFTLILLQLKFLIGNRDISLNSIFTADSRLIVFFLCDICIFSLFHLKYNHTFVKKVNDLWYDLRIEHDYETRKYFWTHKVTYRLLQVTCLIFYLTFNIFHFYKWFNSGLEKLGNADLFWASITRALIFYPYLISHNFILFDLSILAETAMQNIEKHSKELYKELLSNEKVLNFEAIHNLRLKYVQIHQLVDKINEIISPCLLVYLINFICRFIHLVYLILFVQQSGLSRLYQIIGGIATFTITYFIIHLTLQVYLKSQQVILTVYKLSLKTDYLKVLNEITLFVNRNEIGFSLGGICMITSSTMTTLFSVLGTLIIAIPSFAR
uniref:Gustatory receptor n=1 Tax=Tetranychus urticae TaxID=32264 RepID=T1KIK5_TETUR